MSKKNCIIVHWCPNNEKDLGFDWHWLPWIKSELTKRRIETVIPIVNYAWNPEYENFKKQFEKNIISEKTILIWHSCWCAFLVRWLWESKQKISKLILVAPRKIPDEDSEIKRAFYNYDINPWLRRRIKDVIMFTSNNEEKNWKISLTMFHDILWWRVINLENHGHYCLNDMWTEEFPELLEIITK